MDNVIKVNFSKTFKNTDNSPKEGKLLFLNTEYKGNQETGNKEFYDMIKDDDLWDGLLFMS